MLLSISSLIISLLNIGQDKLIQNTFELEKNGQYTLYFGTKDKDSLNEEIAPEITMSLINEICLRHTEGFTAFSADGAWYNGDEKVYEKTLVYKFINTSYEQIKAIMDEVLISFNQGEIMIEWSNSTYTGFYSNDNQ